MAYRNIRTYTKPHNSNSNENGGGITIIKSSDSSNYNSNYLSINTLDAQNANITNLSSVNANIDNCKMNYFMSAAGQITKLQGSGLNYTTGYIADLESNGMKTNKLTVNDEANIKSLLADYLQANNITTDYLTVTKSAHFFELIIDKIRSVQGTQINTAANCIADYVEAYTSSNTLTDLDANDVEHYRIYWKNTDNNGKSITNDWKQYDQAICESFNVNPGTSYDTSNKYYWRLVNKTSNDSGESIKYINFATNEVRQYAPVEYDIIIADGFKYGSTSTSYSYFYSYFDVRSQVGHYVDGQWISDECTSYNGIGWRFTPHNTIYGLEVTPSNSYTNMLASGSFMFDTNISTMLNVGIYYTDGSFDYVPADEYKTNYDIQTDTEKNVEAFIINTAVIDQWDACNWIDLSNTVKDADISGKSAIPTIGDNICQLGYRYNMLTDPTDEDIQRASAIIIAAYNTPDNGDPNEEPAIPAVYPPSYAQYQNITTFDLAHHRGTYFDATGSYIKGNLVAGTTVDPGVNLPVVVDTWKLLSDASVITRDQNSAVQPPLITLSLLNNTGTSSSLVTTLPANMKLFVNGHDNYSYTPLNPLQINMSYYGFNDLDITLQSYSGSPAQVYDELVINTFDINATNGHNGSYFQFIYQNAATQPTTPTSAIYPPSGWTTNPTTPADGEYTWMSQRLISYNASNVQTVGSWITPFRISGESGVAGADGNGIEFIYARATGIDQNTGEPIYPDIFQTRSDVPDPSSTNISFDSNDNIVGWTEYTNNTTIYHSIYADDYIPPSNQSGNYFTTDWTDDPQGVDEDHLYEGVAQRTYDGSTRTWGLFSSPVTWAKYGKNGTNGVNGTNGTNGTDGTDGKNAFNNVITYNKLDCSVTVSGDTLSSITSGIKCVVSNLQVHHIENGSATAIPIEDANYTLYLSVLTSNTANNKQFTVSSQSVQLPWTTLSKGVYNINQNNLLNLIYPSSQYSDSYYRDYLQLQTNNLSFLPIQLAIWVADDDGVQCTERLIIDLNMHAGYINMMSEAGLRQAFFGQYSYNGQTINGMSYITADMHGIETDVYALSYSYSYLSSDYSQFKQTAQSFQTTVTNQIAVQGGEISTMQSQITQMPGQISASVYNTIDGDLQRTGIDITNGTITLDSDKTTVTGEFDLEGTFTSENDETKNKVYIDSYSEGINIYGPDKIQSSSTPGADPDLPDTGYTVEKVANLGWDNDNDIHARTGKLELYNAKNNNSYIALRAGTTAGSDIIMQNEIPSSQRNKLRIASNNEISFTKSTYASNTWTATESQSNTLLNIIGNGHSMATYTSNGTISKTEDIILISGSTTQLTLPTGLTFGKQIIIFNNRSSSVKIYSGSGDTLRGNGSQTISDNYKVIDPYRCLIFVYESQEHVWYLISYY